MSIFYNLNILYSYFFRVVTGIRFVVKNNEISIEIQEGHIAYGSIDQKTVRWNTNKGHPPKKGPETVKLGYKIKSFNLDDIELPADYFVTGILLETSTIKIWYSYLWLLIFSGARFELQDDNHVTLVVRGTNMVKRPFVSDWFYPQVNPGDQRYRFDVAFYNINWKLFIGMTILNAIETDFWF